MKILILGSGLMGPAAAYNVMSDPEVTQVTVADISQAQLDSCATILSSKPGADKVTFTQLDLINLDASANLMASNDAVVAAVPRPINNAAISAALRAGTPLVDLAQTYPDTLTSLAGDLYESDALIVLGCGVEPGLTEIIARHLAEKMDEVHELHIKCGGIPQNPAPPLGYKIVFGGKQMPLREKDSEMVRDGQIHWVPRYSGVEAVSFPRVGQCEAWHEGFKPWILDIPELTNIKLGTQKTVRWPGYAQQVTVLKDLGLLSLDPVSVNGDPVIPKHVVDAVLLPRVRFETGDRDITCLRVELKGEINGRRCLYKAEMVDWYDEETGFTSMARTTAFTGAIVARMIAAGELIAGNHGIVTPEKVISGLVFDQLMSELDRVNIHIDITLHDLESESTRAG